MLIIQIFLSILYAIGVKGYYFGYDYGILNNMFLIYKNFILKN